MIDEIVDGGDEIESGDYLVGYAMEKAEGMYTPRNGKLEWQEPTDENIHIEISVRDKADGRLIPGLDVDVTVTDEGARRSAPTVIPCCGIPISITTAATGWCPATVPIACACALRRRSFTATTRPTASALSRTPT
jgi:hypothetical protein